MKTKDVKSEFGVYDFGLSAEEEERAEQLHAESIIIDMLYWGPCTYLSYTKEMKNELENLWNSPQRNPSKTIFGAHMQPIRLAIAGKFPEYKKCWDDSGVTGGNRYVELYPHDLFASLFGCYIAQFDNMPWMVKALRADDFRRAKVEGKHAGFITTQLTQPISMDLLELVDSAYNLGLRMLMLTYNYMTFVGSGCTERTDAGISNYGAQLISRMNELGIIVDVSHCGRQTTLDACKLSKKCVVASHTSAEGVYKHARAKSDEEFRAIAETGGVIGVYTMAFALGSGKGLTIESTLDHLDYIANLVGWEHVGIGTDWPMAMPKSTAQNVLTPMAAGMGFRPEDKWDSMTNLIGFDDYRDFPNITRGLVKRGYSDEQIKGILGENFLRVFKGVCG